MELELGKLDDISFELEDIQYSGIIEESPIEPKLIEEFGYKKHECLSDKKYQGGWMISENNLYLGYVNGYINYQRFYTLDILPFQANTEILIFYHWFCGDLKIFYNKNEPKSTEYNSEIIFVIEHGVVVEIK
jgi:hypothetical protein